MLSRIETYICTVLVPSFHNVAWKTRAVFDKVHEQHLSLLFLVRSACSSFGIQYFFSRDATGVHVQGFLRRLAFLASDPMSVILCNVEKTAPWIHMAESYLDQGFRCVLAVQNGQVPVSLVSMGAVTACQINFAKSVSCL
jgi:hypothetical protein